MRTNILSGIVLISSILCLTICNIACKTFEKKQFDFSSIIKPIVNEIRKNNNDTSRTSIFVIGFYKGRKNNELKIVPFSGNNEGDNGLVDKIEEVLVVELNWALQDSTWKLKSFNHSPNPKESNFILSKITLNSNGKLRMQLQLSTQKVSFLESPNENSFERYYSYTRPSNSNVFTLGIFLEASKINVIQEDIRIIQLLQDEKVENIQEMARDGITKRIYKEIKKQYGEELRIRYGHFK